MTDINASLKKTIDGEPGPQYKEKGKAEFNFIEGEEGVPYSYDKKVESRLTAIESKLDSVIENGSVNTQLTGSNVEEEFIIERGIYTENLSQIRNHRPAGARGFIAYLYIRGVSGVFASNEGARLRIRNYGYTVTTHFSSFATEYTSTPSRMHVISMYPSIIEDSKIGLSAGAEYLAINAYATNNLRIQLEVRGTFEEGEGIDCEVGLEWIL